MSSLAGGLAASIVFGVFGFLFPFAPNGWGVREVVLAFLFGAVVAHVSIHRDSNIFANLVDRMGSVLDYHDKPV